MHTCTFTPLLTLQTYVQHLRVQLACVCMKIDTRSVLDVLVIKMHTFEIHGML